MKKTAILVALAACTTVHAELLLPKGSKAQLDVEYVYVSEGKYFSPSKDQKRNWKAKRIVSIRANYVADAIQPFGPLHAGDARQQQDIKNLQAKSTEVVAKQAPMAADMYRIAEECKYQDECIAQKVRAYADNMQKPTNVAETRAKITEMAQAGGPRFQLWQMVSQSGTYSIDNWEEFQIYEMTCTDSKVCKRTTTTKGGGPIPAPPGGRSIKGASMFEVDGQGKDVMLTLPGVLAPLQTKTLVDSSIPNDKTTGSAGSFLPIKLTNQKPITVKLTNNVVQASGQLIQQIDGDGMEGGRLTINWKLTVQ